MFKYSIVFELNRCVSFNELMYLCLLLSERLKLLHRNCEKWKGSSEAVLPININKYNGQFNVHCSQSRTMLQFPRTLRTNRGHYIPSNRIDLKLPAHSSRPCEINVQSELIIDTSKKYFIFNSMIMTMIVK